MSVDRLRTTAEAATPGEWRVNDGTELAFLGNSGTRTYAVGSMTQALGDAKADADFVATFDPPTVLLLLDVVEAAEDVRIQRSDRDDGMLTVTSRRAMDRLAEALARLGGAS